MENQDMDALQVRLSVLEHRLRMVTVGGAFILIVSILLGLFIQRAASQATVIRAREISLVDAAGRERIHMSAAAPPLGEAWILIKDASGKNRIGLSVGRSGSIIDTSIGILGEGKGALYLTAEALTLTDKQDQTMVDLLVEPLHSGVEVVGLGNAPYAYATLGINYGGGMFPGPGVVVSDRAGYTAALGPARLKTPGTGTEERRSAASLVLTDNDGKVIWSAP
jgi:hypothetical protein